MSAITISAIETAISARLGAKWVAHGGGTSVNEFDLGNDFENLLKYPAVSIQTEKIGFRRIAKDLFELKPVISIYTVFKHVGGLEGRRKGVYPIVLGTVGILCGQTLGLDIDPLLPAGGISEIFHHSLKSNGLVAFKINLSTKFEVDKIDDETGVELLKIGLNYYLKPGDNVADVTDLVQFEGEE